MVSDPNIGERSAPDVDPEPVVATFVIHGRRAARAAAAAVRRRSSELATGANLTGDACAPRDK